MIIEHNKVKFKKLYSVYDSYNAHPDSCVYLDFVFIDKGCIRKEYVIFDDEDEARRYAEEHFND